MLTWRGVPPGWREAATRPLPERRVFWTRALAVVWALFFLLFGVVAVLKRLWFLPLTLLAAPLQLLFWEPMHRRQVFGLHPTKR